MNGIFQTVVPVHVILTYMPLKDVTASINITNFLLQMYFKNMRYQSQREDYEELTLLIPETCANFLPKTAAITDKKIRRTNNWLLSSCRTGPTGS